MRALRSLLIFGVLSATLNGWAVEPSATCKTCAELEQNFNKLNYFNSEDNKRGYDMMSSVFSLLQKFQSLGKAAANRKEEYKALVRLVAAALPYDMETASADILSGINEDVPTLKSTYAQAVASVTEKCRRQFIATVVEEHACISKVGPDRPVRPGQKPPDIASCTVQPTFNFEECSRRVR